jgi:hypothetical protein
LPEAGFLRKRCSRGEALSFVIPKPRSGEEPAYFQLVGSGGFCSSADLYAFEDFLVANAFILLHRPSPQEPTS